MLPSGVDAAEKLITQRSAQREPSTEAASQSMLGKSAQPLVDHSASKNKVFIVHGHSHGMLRDVEAFVRKIGIEPVVLIDEPNKGQTVIEKFERNADVAFAIVLFSPDDLGRAVTDSPGSEKHRPRQNVVLELGFFIGKLGRNNTVLIVDETKSVEWENPSDYAGVIPIHYSSGLSAWHLDLMKELRAAGITFDWNKA